MGSYTAHGLYVPDAGESGVAALVNNNWALLDPILAGGGGGGGGAPITTNYVTGSADATLTNELILGTSVIMAGTAAARPAAGLAGRLYYSTDTGLLSRDTGAAWVDTNGFGNPVAIGTANTPGSSILTPRADHGHDHGVISGTADRHPEYAKHIQASFSKAGVLTAGVGTFRWYNDSGFTLTFVAIRVSVGTAPTGAALIIDVTKVGTTIYTTQANRPTIAIAGNTVKSTNPDVATIADGEYLTIDVDQIGSTVAGSDLVATVWMRR